MRVLVCLLAPAVAHADVTAHVGAGRHGAIAGGELVLRHDVLELGARVDIALDRDDPHDRGELVGRYRLTPARDERSVFAVAGARLETDQAFVLAGLRFGARPLSLELAVVGHVAGDARFIQHAGFVPGWLARGELGVSRVVLGAELGASGLAERASDGALRGDTRALLTLGVEAWR